MLLCNGLVFHHFMSLFCFFIRFFSPRYPPRYIYAHFKKFFLNKLSSTSIIPLIPNSNNFLFLRSYILNRPTAIEHQVASRIAKAIDQNETINDSLVQMQIHKESNPSRHLIIHYTHEARLETYKKQIHQLWDQIFADTPVTGTELIVGNHNSCNATKNAYVAVLILCYQRIPLPKLLQNKLTISYTNLYYLLPFFCTHFHTISNACF
jgi:hypothetical protein